LAAASEHLPPFELSKESHLQLAATLPGEERDLLGPRHGRPRPCRVSSRTHRNTLFLSPPLRTRLAHSEADPEFKLSALLFDTMAVTSEARYTCRGPSLVPERRVQLFQWPHIASTCIHSMNGKPCHLCKVYTYDMTISLKDVSLRWACSTGRGG
jgi:hypothetical protein